MFSVHQFYDYFFLSFAFIFIYWMTTIDVVEKFALYRFLTCSKQPLRRLTIEKIIYFQFHWIPTRSWTGWWLCHGLEYSVLLLLTYLRFLLLILKKASERSGYLLTINFPKETFLHNFLNKLRAKISTKRYSIMLIKKYYTVFMGKTFKRTWYIF